MVPISHAKTPVIGFDQSDSGQKGIEGTRKKVVKFICNLIYAYRSQEKNCCQLINWSFVSKLLIIFTELLRLSLMNIYISGTYNSTHHKLLTDSWDENWSYDWQDDWWWWSSSRWWRIERYLMDKYSNILVDWSSWSFLLTSILFAWILECSHC